jgi:N-acetylneuraminic acid mutarotase
MRPFIAMVSIAVTCGVATPATATAASLNTDAAGGSWALTGSLHTGRAAPMAVTLPNGKVLVAGGIDSNNHALASAELFDPSSGTWSQTGTMHHVRSNGTLTLLANGKALAAGGFTFPKQPSGVSAELYDPATGKWTQTGSMSVFRVDHTATLLTNGKVLVTGGITPDQSGAIASAEVYDPAKGTWTPTQSMSTPRAYHAATRLSSGRVLVSGGDHDAFFGAQGSAEVYDPSSGRWTVVGRMMTSRRVHTSTALADGTVIVTGGKYGDDLGGAGGNPLAMTDRYDPTAGRWSPVGDLQVVSHGVPTVAGRSYHTATLLNDGRVLVAGGAGNVNYNKFTVFNTSELFDPRTNAWTFTGNMHVARAQHAGVLLADGRALVVGGSTVRSLTATSEIFTPAVRGTQTGPLRLADVRAAARWSMARVPVTQALSLAPRVRAHGPSRSVIGNWALTGSMHVTRAGANGFPAVLLPSGKVLVEGCDQQLGRGGVTAELYDPASGKWSLTGSMHVARCNHGAALLPDGRVLVAGGDSGGVVHPDAEIYDPATGKWTMAAHMNSTRFLLTMVTLSDGRPFVPAGAAFGTIPRDSADLYDPGTGTWTATPSLNISCYIYGSSVLLDGKVLVFGGQSQDNQWTPSSEIYDPAANVWALQRSTIGQPFVGLTLPTGDVLATVPSQLYRESTGAWTQTKTDMRIPRINDTLTLLADGRALAAGGCTSCGSGGGNVKQAELYDPTAQSWSLDAPMNVPRSSQAAVRLHDGRVLVTGGLIGFTQLASAEVYTPAR